MNIIIRSLILTFLLLLFSGNTTLFNFSNAYARPSLSNGCLSAISLVKRVKSTLVNQAKKIVHRYDEQKFQDALTALNSLKGPEDPQLNNPEFTNSLLNTVEQKMAFIEWSGRHVTAEEGAFNPFTIEKNLSETLKRFFKERKFFKRLNKLNFRKMKSLDFEELAIDLYTLRNFQLIDRLGPIGSLLRKIFPVDKNGEYLPWYQRTVHDRYTIEISKRGLIEGMNALNLKVPGGLDERRRAKRIIRQVTDITFAIAVNGYLLIPYSHMLGFIYLPRVKISEWLPVSKAIKTELETHPDSFIPLITTPNHISPSLQNTSEFYGHRWGGLPYKIDVLYNTIRKLYFSLATPPAVYFFLSQFGIFDLPQLDNFMSHWMELRNNILPFLFPSDPTSLEKILEETLHEIMPDGADLDFNLDFEEPEINESEDLKFEPDGEKDA